jgi:hypothetical protein
MGNRTGPTPEEFAQWERERQELAEYIERRRAELHAWEERRRRRLRILTLGLLGR